MFVLSSYPRSGNTYFRNILYHVYGIESLTLREYKKDYTKDDLIDFPVIKAHPLPQHLPDSLQELSSVYLIRDYRDCLVSMAHKRINNSKGYIPSFSKCFLEIIFAKNGSHFGGWTRNVKQWSEKADIIIRFEDLIQHPIREVEKVRKLMPLPEPKVEQLPSFEFLKSGQGKYPNYKNKKVAQYKANLFFRNGKIGSWRNKIPLGIYILLINFHGDMIQQLGYDLYPDSYKYCRIFKNSFVKNILREYYSFLLFYGFIR